MLVVGASNQWFAQTLSALAVPKTGASELATKVEQNWLALEGLPGLAFLPYARTAVPVLKEFERWSDEELWAAIEAHRDAAEQDEPPVVGYPDLRTAEWDIFSAARLPDPHEDFTLTRPGMPRRSAAISPTSCKRSGCAKFGRWSGSPARRPRPRRPGARRDRTAGEVAAGLGARG